MSNLPAKGCGATSTLPVQACSFEQLASEEMGIGPPSNRPSIICARKAQENTHNRIVSSTKTPLIQGVLKSWSTTQSTNIQTRLVSGAPEKHKKQHNRIVSSTRKAQQPDRFEHKKRTNKKHKHTNTFGFWSTRKAQKKTPSDRFEHKKSTTEKRFL